MKKHEKKMKHIHARTKDRVYFMSYYIQHFDFFNAL